MKGADTASPVEAIRDRIAAAVGQQRFRLFLENAKLDLDGDLLRIGVPNLFIQTWLQDRVAGVLQQAASQAVGSEVQVKFYVDGELFRQMRRQQAAEVPRPSDVNAVIPDGCDLPPDRRGRQATLAGFVVGPCNQLAYAAAQQVVASPGRCFNPLYIHGSTGLGKTHLLVAIGAGIRARHNGPKVRYVSAEMFANEYVQSLRHNAMETFRERFRKLDALIVDDIQFLAGKPRIQEEFLHTFNALQSDSRQVVVAADCHPKMIEHFSEGLVNRFLAGMVCRLDPPETDTRVAILKAKAAQLKATFPLTVLRYIAEHLRGSVRELEGALNYLQAHCLVNDRPIDLPTARALLAEMIAQSVRVIQPADVERAVCSLFGLESKELRSNKRVRSVSYPRMIAMYLCRKHTQSCYAAIGKFFGNKNHSTVVSAERTVARWLEEDKPFRIGTQETGLRRLVDLLERDLQA